MRRIRFLLVAVVLASASSVSAQSVRASAKASAAAKSTPAPAARSTKPVAPVAKTDGKSDAKVAAKDAKKSDAKKSDAKVSEADAPITMSQGDSDADAPTFVQTDDAIVMSDHGLSDQVRVKIPDKVSAQELMTQYQRVGRALWLLRDQRNEMVMAQIKAVAITCDDIEKSFKLISIHEAAKTPESRIATSVLLMQINAKIDRMRGMTLTKDCLDNPLAKECL